MHRSKVELRKWFWAFFLVARHKKSISALQLQRDLGLGSYQTAWLMLHKIRSCFYEKPEWPLRGIVEIDAPLVGARGTGDQGSRSPGIERARSVGATRVVGAVELGEKTKGRFHKWGGLRLQRVNDSTFGEFARDNVAPGSLLVTDGSVTHRDLEDCGVERGEDASGLTRTQLRTRDSLPHVRLMFSNLETWLRGRFHGVSQKYLQAYLNEFVYRTSRRFDPARLFACVVRRVTHNHRCLFGDCRTRRWPLEQRQTPSLNQRGLVGAVNPVSAVWLHSVRGLDRDMLVRKRVSGAGGPRS